MEGRRVRNQRRGGLGWSDEDEPVEMDDRKMMVEGGRWEGGREEVER